MSAGDEVKMLVTDDLDRIVGGVDAVVKEDDCTSLGDDLPTIIEIAGVDSSNDSNDSLPDNVQQLHLGHPAPQMQHKMVYAARNTPVNSFVKSTRRAKLQKAAADNDFEMKQLNQQIALTEHYTAEVIVMRKDQQCLEDRLKNERLEITRRNEQLMKDLTELDQSAKQIAEAEAEVAKLREQYDTELRLLEEEKERAELNMQSIATKNREHGAPRNDYTALMDFVGSESSEAMKIVSKSSSQLSSIVTFDSKSSDGSKSSSQLSSIVTFDSKSSDGGAVRTLRVYSKGMRVYYINTTTGTKTPAIILDAHLDDLLEPYYSIQMEGGQEKQTDNAHLELIQTAHMSPTKVNRGEWVCQQ